MGTNIPWRCEIVNETVNVGFSWGKEVNRLELGVRLSDVFDLFHLCGRKCSVSRGCGVGGTIAGAFSDGRVRNGTIATG
jgi:hypothetical protein